MCYFYFFFLKISFEIFSDNLQKMTGNINIAGVHNNAIAYTYIHTYINMYLLNLNMQESNE